MSMLAMTDEEKKIIDPTVEHLMDWAKARSAKAEQLARDATRLMGCTTDRFESLKNQGFFQRCWNRFNGNAGDMERANVNDLIHMQKIAFCYVNMLQEQQLLMTYSLLSLKNNLFSLAIDEEETRNIITDLAERTRNRFEKLEKKVTKVEESARLSVWLLGLKERKYDKMFPTKYIRIFKVINDFYKIKNDNLNYDDFISMKVAIHTVGFEPEQKISLNIFIDELIDEIQNDDNGFKIYNNIITEFIPEGVTDYSKFVIDNISSPVFVSMHGLNMQYIDRLDIIQVLQNNLGISRGDALKQVLRRDIENMNINLNYEFPLSEAAFEILGCLRLSERLLSEKNELIDKDNKHELNNDNPKIPDDLKPNQDIQQPDDRNDTPEISHDEKDKKQDDDFKLMTSNDRLLQLLKEVKEKNPNNKFFANLCKRHGKSTTEAVIQELRDDASDTILRPFTDSLQYDEIVIMVAEKIGILKNELTDDETKNELLIIRKIIQDYVKKHHDAKEKINNLAKRSRKEYNEFVSLIFTGSPSAFFSAIDSVGPDMVSQIIFTILDEFTEKQPELIADDINIVLDSVMNIFKNGWSFASITGPAYRKIIPSVIDITLLRLQQKQDASNG